MSEFLLRIQAFESQVTMREWLANQGSQQVSS
jgi:hypothetical protein